MSIAVPSAQEGAPAGVEELVVIVPVLGRPENVGPLCDSIADATPPCLIQFVADPDDAAEIEAIERHRAEERRNRIGLLLFGGCYAAKVNRGVSASAAPLIFAGADDLRFHRGWLDAARAELDAPNVGVVGVQDDGPQWTDNQPPHFLVSRDYVERHGTIDGVGMFHEGYCHIGCDVELIETARARDAWAFAGESIVEHRHPFWGKGEMDSTYELAYDRERCTRDIELLISRRPLWAWALSDDQLSQVPAYPASALGVDSH